MLLACRQQFPQCLKRQLQLQPAVLFSGTLWDTNYYEFFATTFMPMFQTAVLSGLFNSSELPPPSVRLSHSFWQALTPILFDVESYTALAPDRAAVLA